MRGRLSFQLAPTPHVRRSEPEANSFISEYFASNSFKSNILRAQMHISGQQLA
jgi:hypothetical protein